MTKRSRPDRGGTTAVRPPQPRRPAFGGLIYCGYDYPPDGIGNHLGLIDRLIFSGDDVVYKKSLHELPAPYPWPTPYGGMEKFAHLKHPGDFDRCLYMDVSRDMWNEQALDLQIQLAQEFKQAYHAVTCIYLMWESDVLTPNVHELIKAYDFCIVTSAVLKNYLESHGIDYASLQHPYEFALRPADNATATGRPDGLCFGVSAGLWRRKNIPLIARTFLSAFEHRTDVRLKIHTRFDPSDPVTREQYRQLAPYLESGNIEFTARSLSRADYLDWFRSIDVYCFVSSGEGYSITPREALHLGKPLILLDAHVHADFSHLPGIIRVQSSGQVKAEPNVPQFAGDIGRHWQLDPDSLYRAFVEMSKHYERFKAELREGYRAVLDHHDLGRIRCSWLETLTEKFKRYDMPSPASITAAPQPVRIDFPVGAAQCRHATGNIAGSKLLCIDGRHQPGYCLFSEGIRFEHSGALSVKFHCEILRIYRPLETLITLDAYNTVRRHPVSSRLVMSDPGAKNSAADEYQLVLPEKRCRSLQFRLFWHGGCDLLVSGFSVYPYTLPTGSNRAAGKPG